MTRGKLVVITDKGMFSSIEFNGDMYPDNGHGADAVKLLNNEVYELDDFTPAIIKFNKEHHNYDDESLTEKVT